jgi:hypothetical protein
LQWLDKSEEEGRGILVHDVVIGSLGGGDPKSIKHFSVSLRTFCAILPKVEALTALVTLQ